MLKCQRAATNNSRWPLPLDSRLPDGCTGKPVMPTPLLRRRGNVSIWRAWPAAFLVVLSGSLVNCAVGRLLTQG
jgi:hypothetical protein